MRVTLIASIFGLVVAVAGLAAVPARAVDFPDLFVAWSPDFPDNAILTADNASTGKSPRGPWECGGKNIAPAISWSRAPADARSFAVLMDDPDAALGRGGNHWIVYGVPPTAKGLARGAAEGPDTFVAGDSGRLGPYHGACAEPGAKAHHFIFYVYALTTGPGDLPRGLTKEQFMEKVRDRRTAEASIVARYQRNADGSAFVERK